MDAFAVKAAKKAQLDMPVFQRKGTQNQFLHNNGVLEEVESALVALENNKVQHATERLKEGKNMLIIRLN